MEKFRLQARRFSARVECCAIFSHGSRKSIPSAGPNTSRPSQVVPPKVVDLNEHDDGREEREGRGAEPSWPRDIVVVVGPMRVDLPPSVPRFSSDCSSQLQVAVAVAVAHSRHR